MRLAAVCLVILGVMTLLPRRPVPAAPEMLRPYQVVCPLRGCPAEVWVQAVSGEMPPLRLVRCSVLPEGETCQLACLRGEMAGEQTH